MGVDNVRDDRGEGRGEGLEEDLSRGGPHEDFYLASYIFIQLAGKHCERVVLGGGALRVSTRMFLISLRVDRFVSVGAVWLWGRDGGALP